MEHDLAAMLKELIDDCTQVELDRFGPGYHAEYTKRPDWETIERARKLINRYDQEDKS